MKKIWNIAIWKTNWMLKIKSAWINMLFLPIIFTLIFGGFQSDNAIDNADYLVRVGLISGTTQIDEMLLQDIIGKQLNADVIYYSDKNKAEAAMKNNEINAIVLWENNFEEHWAEFKPTPWNFIYEKETIENYMMEQKLNQLLISLNAIPMMGKDSSLSAKEQVESWLATWQNYRNSIIDVDIQYGKKEKNTNLSRVFVGFTIMFLMFTLNQSASAIIEEKEMGTWQRLLLAPINKNQLILGNILHFFILGLSQFIVLIIVSIFLFNIYWGNFVDTIMFISLIILTFSGLGFMLATFVKTKVQQNVIGSVLIVVTSMLGGVYWSLDFVSETMRRIANIIPQKWAMDGLLKLMSGGYKLIDITQPILILAIFLIVFYVVGFLRLRKVVE